MKVYKCVSIAVTVLVIVITGLFSVPVNVMGQSDSPAYNNDTQAGFIKQDVPDAAVMEGLSEAQSIQPGNKSALNSVLVSNLKGGGSKAPIPYTENFDAAATWPAGWSTDNANVWSLSTTWPGATPPTGFHVYSDYYPYETGTVYSPSFDGTSLSGITVEFYHYWQANYSSGQQDGYFYGSPDGGTTQYLLDEWHHNAPATEEGLQSYNISAWADGASDIVFWWEVSHNDDWYWVWDDFSVTGISSCTGVSTFPYSESFESGFGPWQQSTGDDFNWTRLTGGTSSSGTGPSGAYEGNYYIYTESSSPNYPNRTAGLYANFCFATGGIAFPEISFAYHMYGAAMGTLTLQASTNGGSSWTDLWSLSGNQGNAWYTATVPLTGYGNTDNVILRWWGLTGTSYTSDMAVDYIQVYDNPVTPGLWTGNTSSDWGTGSNWDDGNVPGAAIDVVIPPGRPNYPVVDETAVCNSLLVKDGGTVTMTTGGDLTVTINIVVGDGVSPAQFIINDGAVNCASFGISDSGFAQMNGGYLYCSDYLWVGFGAGGEFELNNGTAKATLDLYSHDGCTVDINGGSLNITNWAANGTIWAEGTVELSGGTITATGRVMYGLAGGVMDGPFTMYVGGTYRNWDDNWATPTDGTVILTGTDPVGPPFYIYSSAFGTGNYLVGYNLIIDAPAGTLYYFNPATDITGFDLQNNFSIISGIASTKYTTFSTDDFSVGGSLTIADNGEFRHGDIPLFSAGSYSYSSMSTYNYVGDAAQTILSAPGSYGNLIASGDGPKMPDGNFNVDSFFDIFMDVDLDDRDVNVGQDLTISGATLTAGNGNLNVAGNWYDEGTFIPESGTVTFDGSIASGINVSSFTTGDLTSLFARDNGATSNYFDIVASGGGDVAVESFDVNTGNTGLVDVQIWYYPNDTYTNHTTDPTGWAQLGATTTVTGSGINLPTYVDPGATVTIPAGQTYAFFVSVVVSGTSTGDIEYTNGANTYSDSYLTLNLGMGSGTITPGGGNTFSPRSWNGTVYYSVLTVGGLENFFNLSVDKTGAAATSFADLNVDGSLDVMNGTFDLNDNDCDVFGNVSVTGTMLAGDGTMNVQGDFYVENDGFTPEGSTVVFDRAIKSYLTSAGGGPEQMMGIGPQTSTYTGNVRGYWYTAPTDFTITALRVPDDQAGDQTIEIVRFNSGPPPFWNSTTNDFTQLGRWVSIPGSAPIVCNISVAAGDILGILGYRSNINSYCANNYSTTIDGNPVTLVRLGMQYNLVTTAAQNLWQEAGLGLSIGRIEMYYQAGSGAGVINFNDLTVDKTNAGNDQLVFTSNTNVAGSFNIATGTAGFAAPYHISVSGTTNLSSGNCLRIGANASGYASFIDNGFSGSGSTLIGSYIVADQWHYVSPPISNAVSGTFVQMYLKPWNENDYTWGDYIVPTNIPLNVGQGYSVWSYGSGPGSKVVYYNYGDLNTGDIVNPVTATDANSNLSIGDGEGWNFVGNPFPSSIEWNGAWPATNIAPTAYLWNGPPPTGNYMTWNWFTGIGTNGKTNGMIAPAQGFFVKATDFSPALTAPQSARMHSYEPFYKNSNDLTNILRLKVYGNNYSDETVIYFNQGATAGFDNNFDSYKVPGINAAPQLYSIGNDFDLAVNTLPAITKGLVVPLGFEVGEAAKYLLWANGFKTFANEMPVYLEDLKEGIIVPIYQTEEYVFFADPNDDPARFLLHFGMTEDTKESDPFAASLTESNVSIYSWDNDIYVNVAGIENANILVYDILGHEVYRQESVKEGIHKISSLPTEKYYIVKVNASGKTETEKVFVR